MDSKYFDGKVVLVTGGSRGIGRAIAVAFARHGSRVIVNYNKSEDRAQALALEMASEGYSVDLLQADVSKGEEVDRLIDEVIRRHDRIDVLVNNAGIRRDGFLAMMAEEDWDQVMNVNLKSAYHTCKRVSRIMIGQRSGNIVNVASLSGLKGLPGQTNYSASKGGLIAFTKSLAQELAPYGIRVNAVAPGIIETDMIEDIEERKGEFLAKIPLARFGESSDVASGVLFLASEMADYITGCTLAIDGGLT